jgi:threonine/homoserine/homoserine lactone efflux protein
MDVVASLPAFVLAVVLISASPGPAMALILRRAGFRGFRETVPTVLGIEAGLYLWALAAAAGFAALVAASEVAYLVLRVVGAGVLVYFGGRALWGVWRERGSPADVISVPAPPSRRGWWAAFGEGLAVNLANPKAAVFMIAFYPQFVPADAPLFATTAALALLQVAIELTLYLALVPTADSSSTDGGRVRHGADSPRRTCGHRRVAAPESPIRSWSTTMAW